MDDKKKTELLVIAGSGILSIFLFVILFLVFKWSLWLCMPLAVACYFALTLLLKPEGRIGGVKISALSNGEALHEKLHEAGEDFERIRQAGLKIKDSELKKKVLQLQDTAQNILHYLTENPEKIPLARRYIDYYQDTAANVLENYLVIQKTGFHTRETQEARQNTIEAVGTLDAAFRMQFDKLMQNELMDMEADFNLLKQTLRSEGYEEELSTGKQERDS